MTVAELIAFLQTQPQDLLVAYYIHSEQKLMELEDIHIDVCCVARPDGWIQDQRPDKPSVPYLMFPGN